jgi:hypothetical protein
MLRIKITIQVEYIENPEINHRARITVGKAGTAMSTTRNSAMHNPMSSKMLIVVVKIISVWQKCISVSPHFFFFIENGARPSNLDTRYSGSISK